VFGAPVGGQLCRKFQVSDISSSSEASATSGVALGLLSEQAGQVQAVGRSMEPCAQMVGRYPRAAAHHKPAGDDRVRLCAAGS
jgi:hypothetical protein